MLSQQNVSFLCHFFFFFPRMQNRDERSKAISLKFENCGEHLPAPAALLRFLGGRRLWPSPGAGIAGSRGRHSFQNFVSRSTSAHRKWSSGFARGCLTEGAEDS